MSIASRLPNAPPVLVGRDADVERLGVAIGRTPVVVAYGPAGVGKLAVALHVLHAQHPVAARTARMIAPAGSVVEATARVLGTAADPEAILERAEAIGAWIVVDGLDPHDATAWPFARLLAGYARDSRWVVLATAVPEDELLAHAVRIGPLADAALAQLAVVWDAEASTDEHAFAVVASRGRPAALRRLLAARLAGGAQVWTEVAAAGDLAVDVLALLRALEVPVSLAAVAAAFDAPITDALATLVDRALAMRDAAATVAIEPRARPLFGRPAAPIAARCLEALAAAGDPAAVHEAIRIALDRDEVALAARLLDRHGDLVFASPFAARLATRLAAVDDPQFGRWRLRAVVELGDGDVLPELAGAVRSHGASDRVLWAEALVRANRLEAALDTIHEVPDAAARLLAARALATRGDLIGARAELALLARATPLSADLRIHATALHARIHALDAEAALARAHIAEVRGELAALSPTARRDVLQSLASTHHELGDLAAAEAMLTALESTLELDPLGRFVGRRARLLRSIIAVERGELAAADAILGELEQASSFASLHRPFIALIGATLALARGDVATVATQLAAIGDVPETRGYLGAWAAALEARRALLVPDRTIPRQVTDDTTLWPTCARLHRARVALRIGETTSVRGPSDEDPVELWFAASAYVWEHHLVEGRPMAAAARARDVATRCGELGFRCLAAEAWAGALDAAWIANDPALAHESLAALEGLAAPLGAGRWHDDVTLGRAFATGPHPEVLEPIAARGIGAASRRARWLLGGAAPDDRIDRAVLGARKLTRARILVGATRAWAPAWGIDRRRQCAWRGDGQHIALDDKPQLWRLLEALVDAPGGLAKEALVVTAWGMPYHPLRHDKLLQNSIHKLRKLVEDEPARPRRIPTTAEGYRIGEAEPFRVIDR